MGVWYGSHGGSTWVFGLPFWLKIPAQAQRPRAASRDSTTSPATLLSSSHPDSYWSLSSLVAAVVAVRRGGRLGIEAISLNPIAISAQACFTS